MILLVSYNDISAYSITRFIGRPL